MRRQSPLLAIVLGAAVAWTAGEAAIADELKPADVANAKGDGPDGKGNTADDTWGFWFELAHAPGKFERLSLATKTMTEDQRKNGIPKKVRGPIGSMLPSPGESEGWIFHRDWDGRFEGVWGDAKTGRVYAYPYVEKTFHGAVAITYKVTKAGKYDISAKLTDDANVPSGPHDGILWRVERLSGKAAVKSLDKGGPIGDGKGPDFGEIRIAGADFDEGDLIRLVISPNRWWGTDLTRIENFKIDPAAAK